MGHAWKVLVPEGVRGALENVGRRRMAPEDVDEGRCCWPSALEQIPDQPERGGGGGGGESRRRPRAPPLHAPRQPARGLALCSHARAMHSSFTSRTTARTPPHAAARHSSPPPAYSTSAALWFPSAGRSPSTADGRPWSELGAPRSARAWRARWANVGADRWYDATRRLLLLRGRETPLPTCHTYLSFPVPLL